ncbi:hypothetical protein GIB67_038693 [Kingdonia uniflora]|uniref:Uncharacterized protein n=1 Tax=Kingdonia uniflora TaxID=39325 RepID=A0A7J7NSY5_9MAGN|nr:hypothetical protein GIB67_038693 [Kingdonia uniflora]
MAASLQWRHHPLSFPPPRVNPRRVSTIKSFQRSDLEDFTKRLTSGESWKEGWRKANDSFEQFVFDAKKAAERIDRDYSVSKQFRSVTESAVDRAREIDREFEVGRRWRSFSVDFNRNLPKVFISIFISGYYLIS